MINKKEFDLLLQEFFEIENKLVELKVLNEFDKSKEYETTLEMIRMKAKDIVLDSENKSHGLDEISLEVFSELIILASDVDYYILKTSNIIESATDNKIDAESLRRIKILWESLEKDITFWNKSSHNPIEEVEYNKHIGKITLDIIVNQLQVEGILDFGKVYKYCEKDYLVNAVKEVLFEGAKDEFQDDIRKRKLVNLAKDISEKDLYDYKVWEHVLTIKNTRSRFDHIEIIGYLQDTKKFDIVNDTYKKENKSDTKEEQNLEVVDDETLLKSIKNWFSNFCESMNQKRMERNWASNYGPAFKAILEDGNVWYAKEHIDKNRIENVKELIVATDGVAKYNFEKGYQWNTLEKIEFLEDKNSSEINLSPDKTYNCIGNDCFANANKLKEISFGKIEMIGNRAFKNCTNLSEIVFPKCLMNIGEDAFLDCSNLTKVTFLGDLELYILERPQNVINCFKGTNLEEIVFSNIETAFNFAIVNCPNLKRIVVSNISNIKLPFKTCKYRIGREEGIVSFVGEKSLNLWKKKNSTIRFFELTEEDKKKYNINM